MRIVFAGTPAFAADHLAALIDYPEANILAVITQPDRPGKRGKRLTPSPVKELAQSHGLTLLQPPRLQAKDLAAFDIDLLIVVAYGQILSPKVLAQPKIAALNVHASDLPRWRGAAPVQRAILAGDRETAISLMIMEAGLDTGPVVTKTTCSISDDDTSGSLFTKLAAIGCETLIETLETIRTSGLKSVDQSTTGITYAHKIEKSEAKINWMQHADYIGRQIRALAPDPVAFMGFGDLRIRCHHAAVADPVLVEAAPGTILEKSKLGLRIQCGVGQLWITHLQLPTGKGTVVSGAALANAQISGITPGARCQ